MNWSLVSTNCIALTSTRQYKFDNTLCSCCVLAWEHEAGNEIGYQRKQADRREPDRGIYATSPPRSPAAATTQVGIELPQAALVRADRGRCQMMLGGQRQRPLIHVPRLPVPRYSPVNSANRRISRSRAANDSSRSPQSAGRLLRPPASPRISCPPDAAAPPLGQALPAGSCSTYDAATTCPATPTGSAPAACSPSPRPLHASASISPPSMPGAAPACSPPTRPTTRTSPCSTRRPRPPQARQTPGQQAH